MRESIVDAANEWLACHEGGWPEDDDVPYGFERGLTVADIRAIPGLVAERDAAWNAAIEAAAEVFSGRYDWDAFEVSVLGEPHKVQGQTEFMTLKETVRLLREHRDRIRALRRNP